mmetsp:Transcript_5103/g.11246  ORF Transcript_5103/g.11246 Transcript_5103/m.11246 type:complete len:224 (+) Transcript_5103:913-1584(+)
MVDLVPQTVRLHLSRIRIRRPGDLDPQNLVRKALAIAPLVGRLNINGLGPELHHGRQRRAIDQADSIYTQGATESLQECDEFSEGLSVLAGELLRLDGIEGREERRVFDRVREGRRADRLERAREPLRESDRLAVRVFSWIVRIVELPQKVLDVGGAIELLVSSLHLEVEALQRPHQMRAREKLLARFTRVWIGKLHDAHPLFFQCLPDPARGVPLPVEIWSG